MIHQRLFLLMEYTRLRLEVIDFGMRQIKAFESMTPKAGYQLSCRHPIFDDFRE